MTHRHSRFVLFLLIFFSVHLVLLLVFHGVNTRSIDTAIQQSESVQIDELLGFRGSRYPGTTEKALVTVYPVTGENNRSSILRVISEDALPFSLLLEDTHIPYVLRHGDHIIAQNLDAEDTAYQDNRAYTVVHVLSEDYRWVGQQSVVDLTLEQDFSIESMRRQSYVILGSEEALSALSDRRLMMSSFLFAGFLLIFLVSIFVYVRFRKNYMLYALMLSFVGAYKFLLTGDLPVTLFTGTIPTLQLNLYDLFTGIIIFLLSQLLCRSLYGFRSPKRYVVWYLLFFFAGELLFLLTFRIEIMICMHLVGSLLILYMGGTERSANRKHALLVTVGYALFSVSVTYQFLVTLEISPRG